MPAPQRENLSRTTSFRDQLDQVDTGPIVLINTFTIDPQDAEAMLQTWEEDSRVMKHQPGFISAQLHEGIAESGVYSNYAVWESAAHLIPRFGDHDRCAHSRRPMDMMRQG